MIGNKSKMRVLGGDEGSASDIIVNVKKLKRILEFKLLKSVTVLVINVVRAHQCY